MTFQKGHDPNRNLDGRPKVTVSVKNKLEKKTSMAAAYQATIQQFRTHEDMKTYQYGLLDYDNLNLHSRNFLHRVFRTVLQDPHLTSQWSTRVMKTMEKEFMVVNESTGEENKALTALLENNWFSKLVMGILNSKLWGFSLLEFGPVQEHQFMPYVDINNKLQPAVNELDRDYVKPEFGVVVKNYGDVTGLAFDDPGFADQLLFVGEIHDAGILYSAAKYILFKDNTLANWSEFAEVFGMPLRVGKTRGEDDDRARLLQAMKAMGSNGYGVIDYEDMIENITTNRTDSWQVYNNLISYCDGQVSKLVFGQDVISNNTGHVIGKTGENVSNLYGTADSKFVMKIINGECFPRFKNLGIGNFEGHCFQWDVSEKVALLDRATIDKTVAEAAGKRLDPEYVQEVYGTTLTEEDAVQQDPAQEKTREKIKNFYNRTN